VTETSRQTIPPTLGVTNLNAVQSRGRKNPITSKLYESMPVLNPSGILGVGKALSRIAAAVLCGQDEMANGESFKVQHYLSSAFEIWRRSDPRQSYFA
jgi:hypothetical protein